MRSPLSGYTLIEVLIFLGVSGVLLALSVVVVGNQQAHTEFTSSMNDVNTKMQQWIDEVANGFSASTSNASATQYSCSIPPFGGGYPELTNSGTNKERGTNPDCIFLGKAVHINIDSPYNGKITTYSVIGRRTYQPGGFGSPTISVDSLLNAQPVAAIFGTPSTPSYIDLSEEYKVPNGARIKSVTAPSPPSYMAGFFSSFNNENLGRHNGSQSLLSVQYPLASSVLPKSTAIKDCIKFTSSCTTTSPSPFPMQQWSVCFTSTRNDDSAVLSIISSNGRGATTKLEFKVCT